MKDYYDNFRPVDDVPEDVIWSRHWNQSNVNYGLHYNSRPNYAVEVNENETYHQPYYLDLGSPFDR